MQKNGKNVGKMGRLLKKKKKKKEELEIEK